MVIEVDGEIVELSKINRAHPNEPFSVSTVGEGGPFVPRPSPPDGSETEMRKKLAAAAREFWNLVEKDWLGTRESKFLDVKMVRNRLLEHAEKGAMDAFGVTSQGGPIVKPFRRSDAKKEPSDAGMISNAFELLRKSGERLSS